MSKTVVIAALESEFFTLKGPIDTIYYSGIGKINSARATTELILEKKPDLILNVGTAGCLQHRHLGGVFGIEEVIERDMVAEPLAPRGSVPFSEHPPVYRARFGTARCATGDSFVTSKDLWLIENQVDLVDMELFAIAKIATHYGVEWRSVKYASDSADEAAAEHWADSLHEADLKISEMIELALYS